MRGLGDVAEELVSYLNFYIDGAKRAEDMEQKASFAVATSSYYEAVGICELLLNADPDRFFHHLIRSAQSRVWLLTLAKNSPGVPDKATRASEWRPLFAAVAARQFGLARRIASLTRTDWVPNAEYEDDFAYGHFLNRLLLGAASQELATITERFRRALEGGESARADLCQAALRGDAGACREAFEGLLEEREKKVQETRKTSAYGDDPLFMANAEVFVEGLGWLALLETLGVALSGEFLLCPGPARLREYAPFEVSTFPSLPLE